MKNKIILLALLVSSNFLVGMDSGAGLVGGAGCMDPESTGSKDKNFYEILKSIEGVSESKHLQAICDLHEVFQSNRILTVASQLEERKKRVARLQENVSINAQKITELEDRGLALEKGASRRFAIGFATGAVVVVAAGAGALVYVVNRKPEMLDKIKI